MLQNDCVSHYCLHFFFIYILVLYRDPVIRKNSRNMFLLLWKFYILVCMEPRWLCFDFTSIILYFSFHCSIPLWYEVCGHWYIAKSVLFEFLNGNLDQFLCLSRSIFSIYVCHLFRSIVFKLSTILDDMHQRNSLHMISWCGIFVLHRNFDIKTILVD